MVFGVPMTWYTKSAVCLALQKDETGEGPLLYRVCVFGNAAFALWWFCLASSD